MNTNIKVQDTTISSKKSGYVTIIKINTLGLEYGNDYESILSLNTQIGNEVIQRIETVESDVTILEERVTSTNSSIIPLIEDELNDPLSNISTSVNSKSILAAEDEWALSEITTNLATEFGPNAANITTKLATYALDDEVGAIAQVALDVNGRITGWTAVDNSASGSAFLIQADTFALTDGTRSHIPFSVDTVSGLVQFNGIVQFSSVKDAPTYTNGIGNPDSTTEPLQSVYLNTTDNSLWTYTSLGWVPGGDPDAITAEDLGASGTTVIDGGRIQTGVIYNTGGTASSYTMKIDLDNGEIHII
jgi:hypothetical protein